MNNIKSRLLSVKIKNVFIATFIMFLISIISFQYLEEQHDFHFVSLESITKQKNSIHKLVKVFRMQQIPLVLFDFEVLGHIFQPKSQSWQKSKHDCKALCKYHPNDMNVISFAVEGFRLQGQQEEQLWSLLYNRGFSVHVTHTTNPWFDLGEERQYLPIHMWLAFQNHVIHIAILHERNGKYVWTKEITEKDWVEAVKELSDDLNGDWNDLDTVGLQFPTHEQVFDKNIIFPGMPMSIDGYKILIPYNVKKLIDEHQTSIFIQCDIQHAKLYKDQHDQNLTVLENQFRQNATSVLSHVSQVLERLSIPFWLTGETFLGYMQQCDLLRDGINVQLAIFVKHFSFDIILNLESQGLKLVHLFGKHNDSLELTMISDNGVVLDINVFYQEENYVWNGLSRPHDGKKYIFKYNFFNLCWTDFLGMTVRIPCQAIEYISAYYGKDWMKPLSAWVWNSDPHNIETNGRWGTQEMDKVIKVFSMTDINYSQEELNKAIEHLESNHEFHYLNDEMKRRRFQEYMVEKYNKNATLSALKHDPENELLY